MAVVVRRDARRGGTAAVVVMSLALAWAVVATPAARAAIVFGQLDDFESGTMGWEEGSASPNPPTTVPDGGPQGAGDAFLRNVAGGSGAGSRQVMFNQDQWTGDYNAAHVTRITGWAANQGATPLHLRVALASSLTQFGSTEPVELPADGVWRRVTFDLTPEAMTRIQGSADLAAALANVTELRLLSAAAGPALRGDPVASTLAVDDLRAMRPEGDANFDGTVNAADLRIVRSNLGVASGATWAGGDFDFDGRVNAKDLALLRRNLERSPAPALTAVPEPAAGALVAAGACVVLRRTRRAAHAR
jgi:hypothetical protein